MAESTNDKDQHDPGGPQVVGGGGTEPKPQSATADPAPQPTGGAGVDLKSSDLPES